MNANDIATKADIQALATLLEQVLHASQAGAPPPDDFLSVPEAARLVGVSQKVLRGWVEKGKYDPAGHLVKLYALDFSAGVRRIPRSALVAYAQGLAYDVSRLVPAPAPDLRVSHRAA